jgi:hypothetical protein
MGFPDVKGILPSFMGGLGNQLWILAAGFVASEYHSCPLYISKNPVENNKHNVLNHDYTDTMFHYFGEHIPLVQDHAKMMAASHGYKIDTNNGNSGFYPYHPIQLFPGTILGSYYQYYPAIAPYEHVIRERLLKGLEPFLEKVIKTYDFSNAAFLHIRRGDYLKYQDIHYIQPLSYYKCAVDKLMASKNPPSKIYIFSDDSPWVKQQDYFTSGSGLFEVIDSKDELESIACMSLCCAGAICANSTFSWWGAFLGSYSVRSPIYVPGRWISDTIYDLFPEEWSVLGENDYLNA